MMFIVFQTRMQNPWQTAAFHSPWSQQDSGITLSTSMGMIGVLEITLIVPMLRVGMPLRTLRVPV